MSTTICLNKVQQVDDVHVLALMGGNAKTQRDRAIGTAVECGNIWLMLTNDILKGIKPYPKSLEDAMMCWTVISMNNTFASVTLEACNSLLQQLNSLGCKEHFEAAAGTCFGACPGAIADYGAEGGIGTDAVFLPTETSATVASPGIL
ncbi:hypothetical protein C8R48DRAFT_674008 [Suillus tomentosus]|nr:hypothetical protein C8R48DRAFT_674008 [Suillus tomentosus]